jgi:hypothetical protein
VTGADAPEVRLGESRWPPAAVVVVFMALNIAERDRFSPTDVMPLTHRAKYTMLLQSTLAFALIGLVVARAVNAFT